MRIVRAPLRITLGGGGTDLPGFYEKHGGFLIAGAINKYIYMTGSRRIFDKKYWLSYSKIEIVDALKDINHELLRQSLLKYEFDTGVELHSISEVPGNSGLGSSGSFLVATLTLLNSLSKREMSRQDVAEMAAAIEMQELKRPCGKQDHFAAAFGGLITMEIGTDGAVKVSDLNLQRDVLKRLQNNLMIYHTGVSRDAGAVLAGQVKKLQGEDKDAEKRMLEIKEIGYRSRDRLLAGDLDGFGRLLHDHWLLKKGIQSDMTSSPLDQIYDAGMKAGALGGKLMGAGGGGFFMFYVPTNAQAKFIAQMKAIGLIELDWRFNFSGCEVVFNTSL